MSGDNSFIECTDEVNIAILQCMFMRSSLEQLEEFSNTFSLELVQSLTGNEEMGKVIEEYIKIKKLDK